MTNQSTAVAFVFCHVAKKPGSLKETMHVPWVTRQLIVIKNWAARENVVIAKTVIATPTYRKSAFALAAEFRSAVASASCGNSSLVLADISELLSRTSFDHIASCIEQLVKAGVPIVDATAGRELGSLTSDELKNIARHAGAARNAKSRAVKDGLILAGKRGNAPPRSNGKRGARVQRTKADNAALRHLDFIRSEQAKLPAGAQLSPSALARALDEAGHTAPRSQAWSHNSAKNLIRRLVAMKRL
jgi:hypothetical protein